MWLCLSGMSTFSCTIETLLAGCIKQMMTMRRDRLACPLHSLVYCSRSWPPAASHRTCLVKNGSSVRRSTVSCSVHSPMAYADGIVCCSYQCLRMTNFLSQPTIEAIQTLLVIGNVLSYNMNPGISYVLLGM
jgi:hypothetical protein